VTAATHVPPAVCLAATVTPLTADGGDVDYDGCAELAAFLARHHVDGIFALGTTGEGLLLTHDERRRAARAFRDGAGGLSVIVHAGALTTRYAAELSRAAAADGAAGVAALAAPGQRLDGAAVTHYLAVTANACSPLPFYAYIYTARSGYAISPAVLEDVAEPADNFRGAKISDPEPAAVDAFLGHGYDVLVGAESLIPAAFDAGAAGAVSGLATAFPSIVAEAVHGRSTSACAAVHGLRDAFATLPLQAALKRVLRRLGLPVNCAVRRPLRPLTDAETREVDALVDRRFDVSDIRPCDMKGDPHGDC
jgi:dihydrodipicolinate synthase/N-acetylneuraminate lyase